MAEVSMSSTRDDHRLFKSENDWWHNACLNYLHDHLDTYAEGYRLAGDLLVGHVKETRSEQDFLVYPIVFLYRQYLELRLKEIIRHGNQYLGNAEDFPRHHDIERLWQECSRIIRVALPDLSGEDLDAVGQLMQQFAMTDPASTAFRYPTDKRGAPSLAGLTHINLRSLSDAIERLAGYLDGVSEGISVYLQHKQDMEAACFGSMV